MTIKAFWKLDEDFENIMAFNGSEVNLVARVSDENGPDRKRVARMLLASPDLYEALIVGVLVFMKGTQ